MAAPILRNDNSAALAGTVHHLYLALEKCFEMDREDQCVVIEKLGDLTVVQTDGGTGSEVKSYDKENPLTDSHPNWWNTLRNWLQGDSRLQKLHALVLETTQPFGEESRLAQWNEESTAGRIEILTQILGDAEKRHASSPSSDPSKPPQTLTDMRYVLHNDRRAMLTEVVTKITISADMPSLPECKDRIVKRFGKAVPAEQASEYIDALLGTIVSPETVSKEWTITYFDFSAHVAKFTKRFHGGRRAFPTRRKKKAESSEIEEHHDSQFVAKILDIDFSQKVPQAISDYLYATNTWIDEFKAHKTLREDYEMFVDDLKTSFEARHEGASAKCTEVIPASQQFYLHTVGEQTVPSFPNLETPNLSYRNGVLHVLMDSETTLKWRLKP